MKTTDEVRAKMRETVGKYRSLEDPCLAHTLDMMDLLLDDIDELLGQAGRKRVCQGEARLEI